MLFHKGRLFLAKRQYIDSRAATLSKGKTERAEKLAKCGVCVYNRSDRQENTAGTENIYEKIFYHSYLQAAALCG